MKKLIALGLSVCMSVSILAGCGGDAKKNSEETNRNLESIGFNETGFPIVDEPITFKMVGRQYSGFPEWNDILCFKEMEKLSNIHMEIETYDSSIYVEKKNLLFGSDDLPDVFLKSDLTPIELTKYGSQGQLIPLEDLIDKYAPNLKKLMEENPDVKQAMVSADGHIYGCPTVNTTAQADIFMINKGWLEKLNLEVPTTVDEFYNVLKAFKEQDPNGNGKADEIPLSVVGVKYLRDRLFPAFNVICDNYCWTSFDDNGKAVFQPFREEFKEAVAFCKKLYDEGLLDIDSFTQDTNKYFAKIVDPEDVIGVASDFGGGTEADVVLSRYEILEPLHDMYGKQFTRSDNLIKQGGFAITSKCKYPEAAIRWIDYLYTEEGARLFWCGVEGVNYEVNEDGTWSTILKDGKSESDIQFSSALKGYSNFASLEPELHRKTTSTDIRVSYLAEKQDRIKAFTKYPTPIMFYAEEDSTRYNSLYTDISNYVLEMVAKFICGQVDFDTEYDKFIKTMKDMGADEMIEIYQRTYDNMMKNLEK